MRISRTRIKFVVFFLILVFFTFHFACKGDQKVKVIKLGHGLDPSHPVHLAMEFLAERIFVKSKGRMRIDVYPSDYGIYTNYYLKPNQPSVYIYTDRPLYRPGHTVYFKGIVRMNDDLDYSLPSANNIEVTISNYDETIYEKTLPLSSFGSFNGELTLDGEKLLNRTLI